ncbi:type VI secretion protein IcmF/TssM N-terminal domain-containing protein [Paraburkholderia sacchari]|uniref:type VI secretion protein IcmF/TssM N-terminal domain-containing protein n=1 Tax=Paraburkholderia sacchari TaxID=159450 RepID=UPI001BCBD967|nr:type VI secretion protein IcmF/TssM N-terminal domain-containing protein [Paraburkholderia sacchari]
MKKLGIVLLCLLALIVLGLVSWGVVLYFGWPLWIALAIFVGALALYFLVGFACRMVVMLRSRSRLARQSASLRSDTAAAMAPETLLRRKWKAAVGTLRQSNLRSQGNPLYVLPWYMVVGQSGTGKTTALTRARLSSPIQKVSQHADIGQTANCDWWYFDRAVVIDCAGRYVHAQDMEQDRREWELGLDLLGRYRPREGLDGLVLAVSADRLIAPSADAFADEGRVVRVRIEQLIKMFGKRFPVYVLITKCDRLYGFEEWAQALPADALDQAMGYLSDEAGDGEAAFVALALDSICARLHALRLALVARTPDASPELLMFPNEFDQLRAGLEQFLAACLADNPYLERPLLRGVFFSSGQQEGGAVSALMGTLLPPSPPHTGTIAGLFLHDFFGRILPQDRHTAKPAMLVNHWRRVTQSVGIAAWLLLLVVVGILLSVSFAGNMQTLEYVRSARPDQVALNGNLAHDAGALALSNDVLTQVAQNDRRWLSGLLGNGAGLSQLEVRLRGAFVKQYREAIQPAVDQNEQAALAGSAPVEAASQILNLARAIGLAQARIGGAGREALEALPQPLPTQLYPPHLNDQLNQLAISSLVWSPEDAPWLRERVKEQRALLDQLVSVDPQMTWLVGLVPDGDGAAPVRASDFWGSSLASAPAGAAAPEAVVSAVYTMAGKEVLDRLALQIRASVSDTAQFDRERAAFDTWYRAQRVAAWQRFADAFASGATPYATEADWRAALGTVSGAQSPYFRLIARLADEFKDDFDAARSGAANAVPLPGWLALARQFQQLREQATRLGAANRVIKVAGAINAVGASAMRQTLAAGPQAGGQTVERNLGAVDALSLYFGALSKLAIDSGTGSGKDYQLAADFHQLATSAQAQPSLMMGALQPLSRLQALIGTGDGSDLLTWRLIRGPFDFLSSYIEQQTSCELQRNWESSVVWALQGALDKNAALDQLFGAKGTVWAFSDGAAKPFITRGANRYDVVETQGYSVPFTPAFVTMLNGALGRQLVQQQLQQRSAAEKQTQQLQAQQAQLQAQQTLDQLDRALAIAKQQADAARALAVPLTVTGQPTGVNSGAKAKPYATILSVQCAAGVQTLNNYNFPVSSSFAWTSGQCGDTRLQIKIGSLVLNRSYPGPLGVAAFLKDFAGGQHQFVPGDFPADQAALDALGVHTLTVSYAFTGSEAVLDAARKIDAYETLQKTTAQQKQQIQDAQLQRQQLNIVDQMAAQNPPLPPSAPTIGGSAPSLADLGLPAAIGACWHSAVLASAAREGGM